MSATTTGVGLEEHGIDPAGEVLRNPTTSQLYTDALERGDGRLAEGGPLVVDTGQFTGRSPKDKFVVREPGSEERIWWGDTNVADRGGAVRRAAPEGRRPPLRAAAPLRDRRLRRRRRRRTASACASSPRARTTRSSRRRCSSARREEELERHEPEALVLHAPEVEADPEVDGTRTGVFVVLHPTRVRGGDRRDVLCRARSRSRSSP